MEEEVREAFRHPPADAREGFMAKSTKHMPGSVVLTP
jgi:hypothetical protein